MENGYTVFFIPWEDLAGKPRVLGRFKTKEEKDNYLEKIYNVEESGFTDEELQTISVVNDYNYMIER